MEKQNGIEVAIRRWAAWAPGLSDAVAWREWASGRRQIGGADKPDVRFVEPLLRRRLSKVGRMAFHVAAECLEGQPAPDAFVFCSRYGEFHRAYDILRNLCDGNEASAAAFSNSVHNAAVSQFAIHRGDRIPSTVIAGNDATLEASFLHAWTLLTTGAMGAVLVVYSDEVLPELYREQTTSVRDDIAVAFLLEAPERAPEDGLRLRLVWNDQPRTTFPGTDESEILRVLKLCLGGRDDVEIGTGRLSWLWSRSRAAA